MLRLAGGAVRPSVRPRPLRRPLPCSVVTMPSPSHRAYARSRRDALTDTTGRYVHDIRCWDNAIAYDGSTPGWAQYLTASGMIADSIGKLHYKNDSAPVGLRRQQHAVH